MQDFGTSRWRSTGYKLMRLPRCSLQATVAVMEARVAYAAEFLAERS
jgi:hypothetical protein